MRPDLTIQLGRFETNALPLGQNMPWDQSPTSSSSATEAAVFALGSRANHSCTPTLNHHWDSTHRLEKFLAVRDLPLGTELTIYYTNPFASYDTRQAYLKSHFKFDCRCEACSLSPAERSTSDARRTSINDIIQVIPSLTNRPQELITRAREALRLLVLEGLVVGRGSLAYDCFQACVAWQDKRNAKEWAQEMAGFYKDEQGVDGEEYRKALTFAANPQPHYAYGVMGRKMKVGGPRS